MTTSPPTTCNCPTRDKLDAMLCDAIKRRANVEQALYDMANGKEAMPDQAKLRELAEHLGTPSSNASFARTARAGEATTITPTCHAWRDSDGQTHISGWSGERPTVGMVDLYDQTVIDAKDAEIRRLTAALDEAQAAASVAYLAFEQVKASRAKLRQAIAALLDDDDHDTAKELARVALKGSEL